MTAATYIWTDLGAVSLHTGIILLSQTGISSHVSLVCAPGTAARDAFKVRFLSVNSHLLG